MYRGKHGELVASPLVTLVDDGTMSGEWGAIGIDDEGHPSQYNVLIEDGVLTDYMWDYLRARKEGARERQRPPAELHAPADGADDEHLRAQRRRGSRRHRPRHRARRLHRQARRRQVNTATGDFVFGMTEAYLIENGEITEPLREGNLHRQRSAGAARHRPARQRLRDGQAGHVRQGRPGRAGRRRPADACGSGPHHRRHRGMSDSVAELQPIADRVVAMAEPGEHVEAYVSRDAETDIRIYEGEVEHFVAAQTEGIGMRVIRDGRTGFAYAGVLDDDGRRRGAGRGARQRPVRHPRRVGRARRARRRRRHRPGAVERRARRYSTDSKIELAKELERLTLAADPRIRVDDANYADVASESAVATTTGIRRTGRENGCYVVVSTLADDGDETQTGFGFSVGRSPVEFDLAKAAQEASERATRLLGATKPSTKRTTVVLDPYVTASFLGIISGTLNGESVAKGRSLFKDRLGENVASSIVTLVDDPTNPKAYTATDSTAKVSPPAATC